MRSEKTPLELRAMWQVKHVADHLGLLMRSPQTGNKARCPLVILSPKAYRVPREAFLRWVGDDLRDQADDPAEPWGAPGASPAEMPCRWEKPRESGRARGGPTPGRD